MPGQQAHRFGGGYRGRAVFQQDHPAERKFGIGRASPRLDQQLSARIVRVFAADGGGPRGQRRMQPHHRPAPAHAKAFARRARGQHGQVVADQPHAGFEQFGAQR